MGDGDGTAAGDGAEGLGGSGGVGFAEPSNKGAVLALLRHKATGTKLLACAIHSSVPMDWHGNFNTTKPCGEVAQLLAKITAVLKRCGGEAGGGAGVAADGGAGGAGGATPLPVVIAGDFNSVPVATADVAPPDVYRLITGDSRVPLASAYASVRPDAKEPAYTSVEPSFAHCIDYIFYTPGAGGVRALGVLDILPVPVETLPATPDPSDHLPLVAEFSIGENAPERAAPPRAPNPAADEPPVTGPDAAPVAVVHGYAAPPRGLRQGAARE